MTKWHKRIDHQLEVLQAKRNTDDSTAEYSTQSKVTQRNLYTAEDNPQHIHHRKHHIK